MPTDSERLEALLELAEDYFIRICAPQRFLTNQDLQIGVADWTRQ